MQERRPTKSPDLALRREADALWRALFDKPAPRGMNPHDMFDVIVHQLEVKDYARLHAADRALGLTWPRYGAAIPPKITSF